MSVAYRLNRLLGVDGNCFDVAIDHGFFNESSFLPGIEDMPSVVSLLAQTRPDAIQLAPGSARHLQSMPGSDKPALVLRCDIANVYGKQLPRVLYSQLIEDPVKQALRADASCVVANLFLIPDQPEIHHQCVTNITRLRAECERYSMPLMVEPLVMRANTEGGGYMVDGDLSKIIPLVRQAAELGADVIKADPSDDISEYHRVVKVGGGVPVLVRGGGRVSDEVIVERTHALMQQGARGIVYGRNVIQHPSPERVTRALMAIVHQGATPQQALQMLKG
jgi:DhnA family fructose-bisphosphate aldolase class Ia